MNIYKNLRAIGVKTLHRQIALGLTVIALSFGSLMSSPVLAAPPVPASTPCDPAYFESLKSRAWLEAQREITQNQNLIYKPDSVLAYTCFDQFLNVLARESADMMSSETRWGGTPPDMTTALGGLVGAAVGAYLTANFNHNYLGNRHATAHPTSVNVTSGGYTCNVMAQVWNDSTDNSAQCMDFNSIEARDGFFTFAEYADKNADTTTSNRIRQINSSSVCPETTVGSENRWLAEINTAFNVGSSASPPVFTWPPDDIEVFFAELDPANCEDTSITTPIPTGVIVQRPQQTIQEFEENVCLAPGCYYVPTAMSAGSCQSAL